MSIITPQQQKKKDTCILNRSCLQEMVASFKSNMIKSSNIQSFTQHHHHLHNSLRNRLPKNRQSKIPIMIQPSKWTKSFQCSVRRNSLPPKPRYQAVTSNLISNQLNRLIHQTLTQISNQTIA